MTATSSMRGESVTGGTCLKNRMFHARSDWEFGPARGNIIKLALYSVHCVFINTKNIILRTLTISKQNNPQV